MSESIHFHFETSMAFKQALLHDKKKKDGKLRFVIPASEGAVLIEENEQVFQFLDSLAAKITN